MRAAVTPPMCCAEYTPGAAHWRTRRNRNSQRVHRRGGGIASAVTLMSVASQDTSSQRSESMSKDSFAPG